MHAVPALQLFAVRLKRRVCIRCWPKGASVGCPGRSRAELSPLRGIAALLSGTAASRSLSCLLQMLSSRDQCYDLVQRRKLTSGLQAGPAHADGPQPQARGELRDGALWLAKDDQLHAPQDTAHDAP